VAGKHLELLVLERGEVARSDPDLLRDVVEREAAVEPGAAERVSELCQRPHRPRSPKYDS
jgi:hypothetical protein